MVLQEFSAEFDVLYNNVTSNQAPGLNEYEKSVFLTKAQSQLVNEYFNQRTDGFGGGFDGSQKRQYDFSSIIKTDTLFNINTITERVTTNEKLDKRSKVYLFPLNYFLAVNEIISDSNYQYSVLPINYSEYERLMLKPYPFPIKKGAWRIITSKKACNFVHVNSDNENLDDSITIPDEFKLLTTWADNGYTLNITIAYIFNNWNYNDNVDTIELVGDNTIKFKSSTDIPYYSKIIASKNNSSNTEYNIVFKVYCSNGNLKDSSLLNIMKDGFEQLRNSVLWNAPSTIVECAKYVDCLLQASAPNNTTKFRASESGGVITNGLTLKCKVIYLPIAEIIGKFTEDIIYKLRYVCTLKPIILEDLTNYGENLTIDGITEKTECVLPKEVHQEILERAVTLAKIAWQGGTLTQAQQ